MTQTTPLITVDLMLALSALSTKHGCTLVNNPDGTITVTPPDIGSLTVTIDPA